MQRQRERKQNSSSKQGSDPRMSSPEHRRRCRSFWQSSTSARTLTLCAVALSACLHRESERPIAINPPPMEPLPCVTEPPPTAPESIVFAGPEAGCPKQFAGCIDVETGNRIAGYMSKLQLWADAAWTACRPEKEAEP